eukprot:scaffold74821_cov98-Cyclotella_meneghiniana.AAC.3
MAYLICDGVGVIAVVVVSFVPKSSKLKTWEMAQEVFKKFCDLLNGEQWTVDTCIDIGIGGSMYWYWCVHRFATYQHSFLICALVKPFINKSRKFSKTY